MDIANIFKITLVNASCLEKKNYRGIWANQ